MQELIFTPAASLDFKRKTLAAASLWMWQQGYCLC